MNSLVSREAGFIHPVAPGRKPPISFAGPRRATQKKCVIVVICILGGYFFSSGLSIYLKAQLAQLLIASAWRHTIEGHAESKPWPWADTWPVARLRSNYLSRDLFILAGADGSSLAFGPGHVHGTALPGEGASVVGAHRDTHFAFLQHVKIGDTFALQDRHGRWLTFAVTHIRVDDIREGYLGLDSRGDFLTLVTCYPFGAIQAGGPLRYVVTAQQIDD